MSNGKACRMQSRAAGEWQNHFQLGSILNTLSQQCPCYITILLHGHKCAPCVQFPASNKDTRLPTCSILSHGHCCAPYV